MADGRQAMKVCVFGLWHLGTVTAASLAARGFTTVGLAESADAAATLSSGTPPLFEPGLIELMRVGIDNGKLTFTAEAGAAVGSSDLIWVAFDTPVDENDVADVEYVRDRVRAIFPFLRSETVVLISSQLPVGSTRQLEQEFAASATGRNVSFACSPENLRLGSAIKAFTEPERIVIGVRDDRVRHIIAQLLSPFCDTLLWTRVESAEMLKHALNGYLATCVTFANEIANICEKVSADMNEVEAALRLDPRVGPKAYVRAGAAFGGGTLARDVQFLNTVAGRHQLRVPLLGSILESNAHHKGWVVRQLRSRLGELAGRRIGVLGLAYKAGTDAIRRSLAVEIIEELVGAGAAVCAFDPKVRALPEPLASAIDVKPSVDAVFENSDAVIIATEWPEFLKLPFDELLSQMARPLLVDQNSFVARQLSNVRDIEHVIGGRA